jgi:hypothetical protein
MIILSIPIFLIALLIHLFASTTALPAPIPSLNPITGILEIPSTNLNNDTTPIATRDTTTNPNPPLTKRTSQIIYLSNCRASTHPYPAPYTRSAIFSYPSRAASLHGELPAPEDAATVGSGVIHWEGAAITACFGSGEIFTSHIDAEAQSLAVFSYAGYGDGNGGDEYRAFSCFRDNARELFRTGTDNVCFAVYYCVEVSWVFLFWGGWGLALAWVGELGGEAGMGWDGMGWDELK